MVATPAIVAVIGSHKESNPAPDTLPGAPARFAKPLSAHRPAKPAIAIPRTFTPRPFASMEVGTLPIHHPRGLANR